MRKPWDRLSKSRDVTVPRRRLNDDSGENTPTVSSQATFRRNQTLVGSSSHVISSGAELSEDASIKSPRATVHGLKKRRKTLLTYLLFGIGMAVLTSVLIYQFTASSRVTLYGQVTPLASADQQRLNKLADQYFTSHFFERFRFAVDRDRMAAFMIEHGAREVVSIDELSFDGVGETVVSIRVREPIARWAIEGRDEFVDKDGVIFQTNYYDTPIVQIKDESGLRIKSRRETSAVTSARFLQFIGQSVGALRSMSVPVSTVILPAGKTRQVDVVAGGTRIVMTVDRKVGEQSQDASKAWQHLRAKGEQPRYIDVRVSGRAFYK